MKRSELKNLMKEIYQKKLSEISHDRSYGDVPSFDSNDRFKVPSDTPKSKTGAKYGYISGEQDGEPLVQVIGYGKLKLLQLEHSAVDELSKLIKFTRDKNYKGALHVIQEKGLLNLFLNALSEVKDKNNLEEDAPITAATAMPDSSSPATGTSPAPGSTSDEPPSTPANQQALVKIEQDKVKATADLENAKGKLAKITRPFTDKINALEKKISDLNIKSNRLRN